MPERLPAAPPSGTLGLRLALAVLLASLLIPSAGLFYTDLLWFQQLGYEQVFVRSLTAKASLASIVALVSFVVLWTSVRFAMKGLRTPLIVVRGKNGQDRESVVMDGRMLRLVAGGGAVGLALVIGAAAASEWLTWELFWNAASFGEEIDPILGYPIGFYIFELPILEAAQKLLLGLFVVALAASTALYSVAGGLRLAPGAGLLLSVRARRHLSALAAFVFLALAWGAWLDRAGLLTTPRSLLHGATNADVAARLPALSILALVGVLAAGLAAYNAFTTKLSPVLIATAAYVFVALAGSGYANALQRFVITPNELVRETPYLTHNIEATRRAFRLDGIETRELSGDEALSAEDIAQNETTLRNVRLWDHQPLLDTFGQIQEIRTYYDFVSVDNDRYTIDGEYRQIMLSPRELDSASLPNRNWINEHLTFTHGYGLALGPVNEVTEEGLPLLFIKDLPPQSSVDLKVEEPSIYYGERSNDYAFVGTNAREFHYPEGEDNVYSPYQGKGGVPIDGLLRKLLFSIRFGSLKILLSSDLGPDTRVLFHRRILERVSTIAPFLLYDSDPYLVISEGRLFWILDAYTISGRYPYSTPVRRGINYIRNSVKIVLDAYQGTTDFYLADASDPIALALRATFPDLLRPLDEMPDDLRAHLRYPVDIFSLQTEVFATYHMTNPEVFYNKEDEWQVPVIEDGNRPTELEPYYTIMRLPGEEREEFIQMLPFTPRRKANLAAWMVARSDGDHYGELVSFQFPKQKVIFGPAQVVARINQDQVISPQITLWNQQGSEVIQGTLLVIPIQESLLYVRPLYLRAQGGRIPELKRVVVAYQNQIVMEETLDAALARLFGEGSEVTPVSETREDVIAPPGPVSADKPLARQAHEHYLRAIEAQRTGDWARYGEELRKLGEALESLNPDDH
jgi:hypothetical protein